MSDRDGIPSGIYVYGPTGSNGVFGMTGPTGPTGPSDPAGVVHIPDPNAPISFNDPRILALIKDQRDKFAEMIAARGSDED